MGGMVEACCLQPIDVIKTRLQLDSANKYKGAQPTPPLSRCGNLTPQGPHWLHARARRGSSPGAPHHRLVHQRLSPCLPACLPACLPPHPTPLHLRWARAPHPGTRNLLHAGIYDCGRQVATQEGVRSLWKGLTPFATHLTLKYALRMGSNSVYQASVLAGRRPPWEDVAV